MAGFGAVIIIRSTYMVGNAGFYKRNKVPGVGVAPSLLGKKPKCEMKR